MDGVNGIRIAPDHPGGLDNDVPLLRLDHPSNHPVLPVATPADRGRWVVEGEENLYALVIGWGFISCSTFEDGKGCTQGTRPVQVQAASVRIEPVPISDPYRDYQIYLDPGTGYTCQGDSGGPLLVTTAAGHNAVAGITSIANCVGDGTNIRVAEGHTYDWIQAQLRGPEGTIDFNGDGVADVFAAPEVYSPSGGTTYQYRYSPGGAGNWVNLAQGKTRLDQLRFGDFDGDNITDILSAVPRSEGGYRYRYLPGGQGSWVNLAWDYTPLVDLRFGDFDGDGITDLFSAVPHSITYKWRYSPGGAGSWVWLNYDDTDPRTLRFGDFDGDGRTDVFATYARDGGYRWTFVSGGTGPRHQLAFALDDPAGLRFGDFDCDDEDNSLFVRSSSRHLARPQRFSHDLDDDGVITTAQAPGRLTSRLAGPR